MLVRTPRLDARTRTPGANFTENPNPISLLFPRRPCGGAVRRCRMRVAPSPDRSTRTTTGRPAGLADESPFGRLGGKGRAPVTNWCAPRFALGRAARGQGRFSRRRPGDAAGGYQDRVETVVPAAFRRIALSPVLFHTYAPRPWYRSVAVLVPLPVWMRTLLPARRVKVPNR